MSDLLMPFFDDHKKFTNGFECGIIWEKMCKGESFTKYIIHLVNKKQIEFMGKRFHYSINIEQIDEEWANLNGSIDLSKAN
jgi:hypothetical protein